MELELDARIRWIEVRGEGPRGDSVFPRSATELAPGATFGSIVILLPGPPPTAPVRVTARGLTADRERESRDTAEVRLAMRGETRVRLRLGPPQRCWPGPCASCGDGALQEGERCDDGGARSRDGCSSECEIEPGYACTGAPSACFALAPLRPLAVEPDTTREVPEVALAPRCGDGRVEGSEGCDDGADDPGDGCSETCAVEAGFTCEGAPSTCRPVCGDGRLAGREGCDDGNQRSQDGCSETCAVEEGFECVGEPSRCEPVCSEPCGRTCPRSGCCVSRCDEDDEEDEDCSLRCPPGCACLLECGRAEECEARCSSGSWCEVACGRSEECQLDCSPGARCILACQQADSCEVERCRARSRTCSGDVLTCNATCP